MEDVNKEFVVGFQYKFLDSVKVNQFRDLGNYESGLIDDIAQLSNVNKYDSEAIAKVVFQVDGIDIDGDVTEISINGVTAVLPSDVSCWFLKTERELFEAVTHLETLQAHRAILQQRVDELTGMISELDEKIKLAMMPQDWTPPAGFEHGLV